jgi:hypothetical protein
MTSVMPAKVIQDLHLVKTFTKGILFAFFVFWLSHVCSALDLQKHDLMEHVAHQCICMQYILELSNQLDVDPRACVSSFFTRYGKMWLQ